MRGISVAIAVALLATSAHADYRKEQARLNREAKLLFATVAKQLAADRDYPIVPCGLAADWSTYGIDYATAHKALGLDVHGNLANPDYVAKPTEVFGSRVPKEAFCDDDARSKYVAKRVTDWQAAFKASKGAKPPPRIELLVRSFSFPFFDRTFRRASSCGYSMIAASPSTTKANAAVARSRAAGAPSSIVETGTGGTRSTKSTSSTPIEDAPCLNDGPPGGA